MKRLFITGAGTGIGKTFVTELLIRELRGCGKTLRVLKPIVTGFETGAAATSDTGLLLAALGQPIDRERLDRVSPWRFAAPLAPDMAAMRENREVPFDELIRFCRADDGSDVTLIEGVGGVMVPLDAQRTVLDWIDELAYPAVLVTGSYLGAISHVLSAFVTLASRNIPVPAIIVSESTDPAAPLAEVTAAIARHVGTTRVIALPRLSGGMAAPQLAELLGGPD